MHNVEKSAFQKGQYVGYGGGAVWHIRNYGKGNWKATPQGNNKHSVFSCATLRDVSTQLETLNKTYSDEWRLASLSSERKANPVKRSARFDANFKEYKGWHRWYKALFVKYPDAVITGDEQRAIAFSPYQAGNQIREGEVGRWNSEGRMGITEAFGTIYDMPTKMGRLTNPATRKRAISRPSQVTKKAPSKRLVSRRKAAAKKPVKGYFPNPVAITAPGPSRKTHEDLPHLFPQPGGAYMISFWRESTKKWVPATLEYSITAAKKWLEYQGYKKAVLLK